MQILPWELPRWHTAERKVLNSICKFDVVMGSCGVVPIENAVRFEIDEKLRFFGFLIFFLSSRFFLLQNLLNVSVGRRKKVVQKETIKRSLYLFHFVPIIF